jgi:hypothetical protein
MPPGEKNDAGTDLAIDATARFVIRLAGYRSLIEDLGKSSRG